jgi:hypothetical protein
MEMIRYRPATSVPGKNLPLVHEEWDELNPESGREPEREPAGRGVGVGESIVASMSAVMLATNVASGTPQKAQNGVDCVVSFPQP